MFRLQYRKPSHLRTSHPALAALPFALVALVVAAPLSGSPARAAAATRKTSAVPAPPGLESSDPEAIKRALDDLRISGAEAAKYAPAIAERLQSGLPTALTIAAIDTLADIGSPSASDALAEYAHHRISDVRSHAVVALTRTRGPLALPTLRHELSDLDPKVRGLAAVGLGRIGTAEVVPDLFAALNHQVPEAAESIGLLCDPAACERLVGTLGHFPLSVLMPGIDALLFRPTSEVSEVAKVKVVWSIRELGTGEAHNYLAQVRARLPKSETHVLASLDQAILATAGAPGAGGAK